MNFCSVVTISDVERRLVSKEFFSPKKWVLTDLIGRSVYYRGENFSMYEKGEVVYSPDNDRVSIIWEDESKPTPIFENSDLVLVGLDILEKCTLE